MRGPKTRIDYFLKLGPQCNPLRRAAPAVTGSSGAWQACYASSRAPSRPPQLGTPAVRGPPKEDRTSVGSAGRRSSPSSTRII